MSIFGSARIKANTNEYAQVYELAKKLAKNKTDVVTGGGPGLMEAANAGSKDGGSKTKSFGLHIDLPFETTPNDHLDITYHHKKFSSRLDEFMRISHAVIVTPGGIGTILELLYTWQLIQVGHISERPVILLGEMWNGLIDWMESEPLKKHLIEKSDFKNIQIVQNVDEKWARKKFEFNPLKIVSLLISLLFSSGILSIKLLISPLSYFSKN